MLSRARHDDGGINVVVKAPIDISSEAGKHLRAPGPV
jgi:hypothetical protein